MLQSVLDDKHSRRFVFVCRSFTSALVDSFRKLDSQVQGRIRLVQMGNLSHTDTPELKDHNSDEDDFGHVDMLSTIGNIHVIQSSTESLGNGNDSYEGEIFANKTLLEFLSDQIGSNAVLYAVDTPAQLDRCLQMDAVQRLIIAGRGEVVSSTGNSFIYIPTKRIYST